MKKATKQQFLAGFRELKSAPTARVGAWTLRREKIYSRGVGPAWYWYYYAHKDGEQFEIGGWSSFHTAASRLAFKERS